MVSANRTALTSLPQRAAGWLDAARARRLAAAFPLPTRLQIATWAAVMLAMLVVALFDYDLYELGMYQDDASYIILARSLVESDQYGLIFSPGEPAQPTFPFGFPLLLAPFVWALPGGYDSLKYISLFATLLNGGLLFWGWPWLSRSTSRWWGLAVTACYGLNPLVVSHARLVMSEAVFLTIALTAILIAERVGQGWAGRPALLILAAALTALPNFRSVGLVFVLVILVDLFFRLGRRALQPVLTVLAASVVILTAIIVLTPVAPDDLAEVTERYAVEYMAFVDGSGRSSTYSSVPYPVLLAQRSFQHLARDIRSVVWPLGGGDREREFFAQWGMPFLRDWLGLAIGMLVVVGVARGLRRDGGPLFWTTAVAYYGMVGVWNWSGGRLLYPVAPHLYLGLFLGMEAVGEVAGRLGRVERFRQAGRWLPGVAATLVLGLALFKTFSLEASQNHIGSLSARTQWVVENTDPTAVVMSDAPHIDFLYSNRPMVYLPAAEQLHTANTLSDYLSQQEIEYVLVTPSLLWQDAYRVEYDSTMKAADALLIQLQSLGRVKLVHELPSAGLRVYRVEP